MDYFQHRGESFKENISNYAHSGIPWEDDFISLDEKNNYTEPIHTDMSWWRKAPVKNVLVLSGDYEIFQDDVRGFSKTLGDAGLAVTAVNCARQVDIDCILHAMSGLEPGSMSTATWDWLQTVYN
jgi:acetyl esterase/lipase